MKNAIKYYYSIVPETIKQDNKNYKFLSKGVNYALINYDGTDIEEIYKMNLYLINNNYKTNNIILNNNNSIVTIINNEAYVLIMIKEKIEKINFQQLIEFNNVYIPNNQFNHSNWFDLWTKKVDYFEYQINQLGLKYALLRESFSYYVGLTEIAIVLFKEEKAKYLTLNHKRINYNDTTFELYNPLNYIIDYRFRDACEYFKSMFFKEKEIDIIPYLNNLLDSEKYLFFVRVLYPSYYFDYYEKIINSEIDDSALINILKKTNGYEVFLKRIYTYLKNYLPEIEWFDKLPDIYDF